MDPFSSIPIGPPPPIPPPPIIPVFGSAVPIPTTAETTTTTTTTTVAGLQPNHPPYPDMIREAIGALKEANGSSKRAIAKYIESAYKDLPQSHPAKLTQQLKSMKNSGLLVMVKKSYKLPSATATARSDALLPDSAPLNPPDASAGPKRGRGRPPKPKSAFPTADPSSQQSVLVSDGPKKSPGRPRKEGPVGQLGIRKGRGRPPKSGPKKSPGRPRKPKTVRSVVGANAMKRGRGRPPKVLNQFPQQAFMPIQGQPMAVPYADAAAAATAAPTATGAIPNLPRPRGRPKGAAGVVVPGKRRGRPPKFGGVTAQPIKPRKTTGKPVGRPKKTTNGAESKVLAVAYGDLKRKLEFFQSKVKQAIGVLKPQFTNETNISAIGAIQELEGLAAMDISTPFRDDAQLPPQPAQPPPPPPPVLQSEGQVH